MFSKELVKVSARNRVKFYELFGTNKKVVAELFKGEQEVAENFELNYATPELRKIAAKAKRTGDTEVLNSLPKDSLKFTGRFKNGDVIDDKESIDIVNEYLSSMKIINQDMHQLIGVEGESSGSGSNIILGREIHYWNLHPNSIHEVVYESLFSQPHYVVSELEKLAQIKIQGSIGKEVIKVFQKESEIIPTLDHLKATQEDINKIKFKLMNLIHIGNLDLVDYKSNLLKALEMFIESDNEFKLDVYKKIGNYLPQYNNQKTKYFVTLLSQYNTNNSGIILDARIDFNIIYAYYRKAVELCS